jgi:hypothetical protein
MLMRKGLWIKLRKPCGVGATDVIDVLGTLVEVGGAAS